MFLLTSNQMWFGQTPLFFIKKNKRINETNKKKDYILTKKEKEKNSTSEHLVQLSKRKCVFISTIHSLIFFIYFLGCGRLINI